MSEGESWFERLGGSIEFESEPGRTVFQVWLPLDGAVHS